jgi:limonene-1,2-epoxide hydrolase
MSSSSHVPLPTVVERLINAINAHDLDAFMACIAADYHSVQPLHPDREFTGSAQVRQNWSAVFAGVPDLRWHVLRWAVDDRTVWIEVHGGGSRVSDGARIELGGVLINEVHDDQIIAARIYFDEISAGAGIDASVAELYDRTGSGTG